MKIVFEFSEKQVEFLKQYAKVYDDERKEDVTADPIVVVEKQTKIPTRDGLQDDTQYIWIDDWGVQEFETLDELEEALLKSDNEISEEKIEHIITNLKEGFNIELKDIGRFEVDCYQIRYNPVAYFLTRVEAEKYTKYQKHNLGKARVYTRNMGYDNRGDLVEFRKILLEMGKMLNGRLYNG